MKNKIIIIVVIILLFICGLFGIFFIINNNFNDEKLNDLVEKYEVLNNYLNKHKSINEGVLEIDALYRGAHGENYPNQFTFYFIKDVDTVTLSNETGFYKEDYQNNLLDIINKLKKISVSDIEGLISSSSKDKNKYTLDTKKLSTLLDKDIKASYIKINSTGLLKKLDSIDIIIDDVVINIKDKSINITYKDNLISIRINNSGYYLNINNKLKMNAFLNEEKNTYSIIIDNKVYDLTFKNDELIINSNNQAAIYNGLIITVKETKASINYDKTLSMEDVPVLRYYKNIDNNFWR